MLSIFTNGFVLLVPKIQIGGFDSGTIIGLLIFGVVMWFISAFVAFENKLLNTLAVCSYLTGAINLCLDGSVIKIIAVVIGTIILFFVGAAIAGSRKI